MFTKQVKTNYCSKYVTILKYSVLILKSMRGNQQKKRNQLDFSS